MGAILTTHSMEFAVQGANFVYNGFRFESRGRQYTFISHRRVLRYDYIYLVPKSRNRDKEEPF